MTFRFGGRRHWITVQTDTPEAIEEAWRSELLHHIALRAVEQDRIALLEALDGLPAEQARSIYHRACTFMGRAMTVAIDTTLAAEGMPLTPETPTDKGAEARIRDVVRRANKRCLGSRVWDVIDNATADFYDSVQRTLQARVLGWESEPARKVPKRGPRTDEPPAEYLFTPEELRRLEFWRQRARRGDAA